MGLLLGKVLLVAKSQKEYHQWCFMSSDRCRLRKDLSTKDRLVKAMVFPVVMYGCESWTIKKAELQRIDAFELWCWRRLFRVPWTTRRSNQSILKENSPGCSSVGLMLKLKFQYFGHLMQSWLIWKDPDAGKDWRQEEKGMTEDEMVGWHHRLNGHEFGWTSGVGDGQGGLMCCSSWGHKEPDTTEQLNWELRNWKWSLHMYLRKQDKKEEESTSGKNKNPKNKNKTEGRGVNHWYSQILEELQEGRPNPLQGPRLDSCLTLGNELSQETQSWQSKRLYKGAPGWEQEGWGAPEDCSAPWFAVLGFTVTG